MQNSRKLTALVLATLLLAAGCGSRQPLEYWFVDSLTNVFPDDEAGTAELPAPVFDAARNSHTSFQLALRAPAAVGDLYADALPLTGPGIPMETMSVRWVEYVTVTNNSRDTPPEELLREAPALFPDPVLEGFPITVSKDTTRSLWFTLHVPANQEPGEYEGVIRLRQGRDELARIPYRVRVHAATVPSPIPLAITNYFNFSDRHLQQFFGCAEYSTAWWELMRNIAGFMASYHQTSVRESPVSMAQAEVRGGRLQYDFSNFERYVETFRAAGVRGHIEGSNLARRERRRDAPVMVRTWVIENGEAVSREFEWNDPRAVRFLNDFLPALHAFLEDRGWTGEYLQGILDEPREWERDAFVAIAELVRRHMPGVRTIEPVSARQDLEFMEKTVDVWVVHLGTIEDRLDDLRQHTVNGGELWYYTALSPRGEYPNRLIDFPVIKTRLLHWINYKYDFGGYLHWGGNFWGPQPFLDTQPVINQGRTYLPPGDAYITYPNRAGRTLYSSIRLEQMREGIEDYGLLVELAKTDEAKARELAGEMVQSFTEYVRDPSRFRELHEELLGSF